MQRSRTGTYLGWLTTISAILIMLAGSDWPPPIGFLLVVAAAAVLGVLVRRWIPWTLRRSDQVPVRQTLLAAAGVGAGMGLVVAGVFTVAGLVQ
ncbi:MAG: hypothetical protein RLZ55_1808, partial [Actinomycetota bacterium]